MIIEEFIVEGFIASLKVITIFEVEFTAVALFAGVTDTTVGGVISEPASVVKFQTESAFNAFPAISFTPLLIDPVYTVFPVKDIDGLKVAIDPEQLIVPVMAFVPCINVNVEALTVDGSTDSLNVTDTFVPVTTDNALFAGNTELTAGGVASTPLIRGSVAHCLNTFFSQPLKNIATIKTSMAKEYLGITIITFLPCLRLLVFFSFVIAIMY
jgi:hypothetical protein